MLNKSFAFGFILFFLISSSTTVFAEQSAISQDSIAVSNKVMTNIYKEIFSQRWNYDELKDFNRNSMVKGELGIYRLYYRFNEYLSIKKGELYHFGISINELGGANEFELLGVGYKYGFPVLGIQLIAGTTEDVPRRKQFDVGTIIENAYIDLWRFEQKRLPYQITALSMKNSYEVGEPIQIQIELQNMTRHKLRLKAMGSKSLSFEFNDRLYGPPSKVREKLAKVSKAKSVILKPQEKIVKRVKFAGFMEPGEYEISGTYLYPHDNVFPQSVITITVRDSDSY